MPALSRAHGGRWFCRRRSVIHPSESAPSGTTDCTAKPAGWCPRSPLRSRFITSIPFRRECAARGWKTCDHSAGTATLWLTPFIPRCHLSRLQQWWRPEASHGPRARPAQRMRPSWQSGPLPSRCGASGAPSQAATRDIAARDESRQCGGGLRAGKPVAARLPGFRRVDAEQADSDAGNLERVTIDHTRRRVDRPPHARTWRPTARR